MRSRFCNSTGDRAREERELHLGIRHLLVALCGVFLFSALVSAQTTNGVVREPSEFPGGQEAMAKWIGQNLIFPDSLKTGQGEAKVQVRFVVGTTGEVGQAEVVPPARANVQVAGADLRSVPLFPRLTFPSEPQVQDPQPGRPALPELRGRELG